MSAPYYSGIGRWLPLTFDAIPILKVCADGSDGSVLMF